MAIAIACAWPGPAQASAKAVSPTAPTSARLREAQPQANPEARPEGRDVIESARSLIAGKRRSEACALLLRAIARETKGSPAQRELAKALEELAELFLTEQGQAAWSLAESQAESKPRDAIDSYQAALKLEGENGAVLKGLARAHLALGECERAEAAVKRAESAQPASAEVRLLRAQALDCKRSYPALEALLAARDVDLEPVDRFLKSVQAKDLLRKGDPKKAKAFLAQWEQAYADYPELQFWKWKFSEESAQPDRAAAVRYVQLCENLTARKRKAFRLDVDLCKGKDVVEAFLKSAGLKPSTLSDQPPAPGGAPGE